jgi:hypothetical protein
MCSYLQFEFIDGTPEPSAEETACRESSSSLSGINQNKTLCEVEQRGIQKCI